MLKYLDIVNGGFEKVRNVSKCSSVRVGKCANLAYLWKWYSRMQNSPWVHYCKQMSIQAFTRVREHLQNFMCFYHSPEVKSFYLNFSNLKHNQFWSLGEGLFKNSSHIFNLRHVYRPPNYALKQSDYNPFFLGEKRQRQATRTPRWLRQRGEQ